MFEFEHPFGGLLTGKASATVKDPDGIEPPSTIIQTDHAWEIQVAWEIAGVVAPFLGGEWFVEVYVESIGRGAEKQVGATKTVPLANGPVLQSARKYETKIRVPAGDVAEGVYKLVTLISYRHGGVPLEMAAFVEGPLVRIYKGLP